MAKKKRKLYHENGENHVDICRQNNKSFRNGIVSPKSMRSWLNNRLSSLSIDAQFFLHRQKNK